MRNDFLDDGSKEMIKEVGTAFTTILDNIHHKDIEIQVLFNIISRWLFKTSVLTDTSLDEIFKEFADDINSIVLEATKIYIKTEGKMEIIIDKERR